MRYQTQTTVQIEIHGQTERATAVTANPSRKAAFAYAHNEAQDPRTVRIEVWEVPEHGERGERRRILFYDLEPVANEVAASSGT